MQRTVLASIGSSALVLGAAALLTMSLECAAQQQASNPESAFYKGKDGKLRILTVPAGIFDCHPNDGKKRKCNDIPVIVLRYQSDCIALLPYNQLHVGTQQKKDDVTWTLIGPPDYTFGEDDGITLMSDPNSGDPSNVWIEKSRSSAYTFRWRIKAGAPASTFQHEAHVYDSNRKRCIPGDPAISNDAN